MLLPNLGPPPEGCMPSVCWAEDLSALSQPLSCEGLKISCRSLGCLGAALKVQLCSPHLPLLQQVVQSSYCLLRLGGQGATAGGSQRAGRLPGAHREVSFCVPWAVMVLAPRWDCSWTSAFPFGNGEGIWEWCAYHSLLWFFSVGCCSNLAKQRSVEG